MLPREGGQRFRGVARRVVQHKLEQMALHFTNGRALEAERHQRAATQRERTHRKAGVLPEHLIERSLELLVLPDVFRVRAAANPIGLLHH